MSKLLSKLSSDVTIYLLHCKTLVRFIAYKFRGERIGRADLLAWPPKIPDLTPLEFNLLGLHKNIVYAQTIQSQYHLKERITDALVTVTADTILRTWTEVDIACMCVVPQVEPTSKATR